MALSPSLLIPTGAAIFSTHLGQFPPRPAHPASTRCPIVRSNSQDDQEAMATSLEAKFPQECRKVCLPILNLYDYFDHYDLQLHGPQFLLRVLELIVDRNVMRWRNIFEFADEICHLGLANLTRVVRDGMKSFTKDQVDCLGADFLRDALEELERRKNRVDNCGE